MNTFRFLRRGLVSVCVSLSSLLGYGGDVRDGFFIEGSIGAQSSGVSSYGPNATASTPSKTLNAASLQASLNSHLKELATALQNLNATAAQVGSTKDILQLSPLDISGTMRAQIKGLEAQIQMEIGQLKTLVGTNPNAPNVANDQTIIQDYEKVLQSLQGYGVSIIGEVNNYDNTLAQAQIAFKDLKNAIASRNSASQKAYDAAYSAYEQKKQAFSAARDQITRFMGQCVGGSCGPSSVSPAEGAAQVEQFSNSILQGILGIAQNPDTDSIISINQYYNSYRTGVSGVCAPTSTTANIPNCFSSVDPVMSNFSIENLVRDYAWFFQEAKEIGESLSLNAPQVDVAANGLVAVYNTLSNIMQTTLGNYSSIIPTPDQYFRPPAVPVLKPMPSPPTLGFKYNNLAPQITTAANTINTVGTIHAPGQIVVPDLSPFSNVINHFARAFQNVNWNANVGVGYQYFFSRHFGFDVQVSVGYNYLNSPLFRKSPIFKSMQGFNWAIGGNVIFDFIAPSSQSGLFVGLFAGILGVGSHYFLDTKSSPLVRASDFNARLNVGIRFQFDRNIIKVGIEDPLYSHVIDMQAGDTHFIVDETPRNFDIYISFAHLF
ncbi:hypothetical protein [Helicobacter salomonis]|uniref:OMP1433 n=1 Tax=Helicobacter salomonis TaxID=56878 RepID=A0A1M4NIT0_9HELI|nr:hypothetical protein [Helicobacter salomonis]SFZ73159.1 OMP1433 [Helicobacter salomonis]